jgi:hypothetical protein
MAQKGKIEAIPQRQTDQPVVDRRLRPYFDTGVAASTGTIGWKRPSPHVGPVVRPP